jgi:hypothetical protein
VDRRSSAPVGAQPTRCALGSPQRGAARADRERRPLAPGDAVRCGRCSLGLRSLRSDPTGSPDPRERWMRAARWCGADATGGNRVGHRRRRRLGGPHCLSRTNVRVPSTQATGVRIRRRLAPSERAAPSRRRCRPVLLRSQQWHQCPASPALRSLSGIARFHGPVRR